MIRTINTPVFSRSNIVRALMLSTTFVALAACEAQQTTAPEMDSMSASAPAFNKGKGGNQPAAPVFPARAIVRATAGPSGNITLVYVGNRTQNVTAATRLGVGRYCFELSPEAFPDGTAHFVLGIRDADYNPAVGGYNFNLHWDCPAGWVGVQVRQTSTGTGVDTSFHLAIF